MRIGVQKWIIQCKCPMVAWSPSLIRRGTCVNHTVCEAHSVHTYRQLRVTSQPNEPAFRLLRETGGYDPHRQKGSTISMYKGWRMNLFIADFGSFLITPAVFWPAWDRSSVKNIKSQPPKQLWIHFVCYFPSSTVKNVTWFNLCSPSAAIYESDWILCIVFHNTAWIIKLQMTALPALST